MSVLSGVVVGGIWLLSAQTVREAPWALPVIVLFVAFTFVRVVHRTGYAIWSSYEIELLPDRIVRRQANTPDIVVLRGEVTSVSEVPGRAINVIGASRDRLVSVPALISEYESVRAQLLEWAPARKTQADRGMVYVIASGVTGVGLLVMAFSPTVSPGLGALAAGLLAGLLLYLGWQLPRSPHFDAKTRRSGWWGLLLLVPLLMRVFRYVSTGE